MSYEVEGKFKNFFEQQHQGTGLDFIIRMCALLFYLKSCSESNVRMRQVKWKIICIFSSSNNILYYYSSSFLKIETEWNNNKNNTNNFSVFALFLFGVWLWGQGFCFAFAFFLLISSIKQYNKNCNV